MSKNEAPYHHPVIAFTLLFSLLLCTALAQAQAGPESYIEHNYKGFKSIFEGTLEGWDGDPSLWKAQNSTIIGETYPDRPIPANTFLIWRGHKVKDFDLKIDFRMNSTNSGLQYRSADSPGEGPWVLRGYQADFDFNNEYTGALYEERGPRGLITRRGDMVQIETGKRPRVIGHLRDSAEIRKYIKANNWNHLHVVARANVLIHILNGHVTSVVIDDDVENRVGEGLLGLQLHTGAPMKVEFRNLYLKSY